MFLAKAQATSAWPSHARPAAAFPCRSGAASCTASGGRDIRVTDCEISRSGGNGIWFEQVSGDVSGNIFT